MPERSPSGSQHVTSMLRKWARLTPNAPATIANGHVKRRGDGDDDDKSVTYAETLDRVTKFASSLLSEGLSEEGRVAVVSLNSHRYFESFFSVAYAGGIIVPINIRLAPPEMAAIFEDCEPEFVIVDDAFSGIAEKLAGSMPSSFKAFIYAGENPEAPAGCLHYETLIASGCDKCEDALRGGDDTFGLFYTGGTTGKSKGVMLTHGNIFVNALGTCGVMQYSKKTRYLHAAPMFHLADAQMTFAVTIGGGAHVLIPKFTPPDTLAAIQNARINKALLVPVMITFMMKMPNVDDYDMSTLETILYGGSPMAESLLLKAMKMFPNSQFQQGYGMTECSPCISLLPSDQHFEGSEKLKGAGMPAPWVEVRIVDAKGNELERGKTGEIVVRGPNVMKGYWKQEEKTKAAIVDGWMHTGDGGYMDDDGFIFLRDRLKDMIVSGGENVYSSETESAVQAHPSVAMCAVIGTPDEKYGELVTAVVTLKPETSLDLAELKAHCAKLIAGYKCPRRLEILDKLPISGAGKILKHEIRQSFWKDSELSHTQGSGEQKSSYS